MQALMEYTGQTGQKLDYMYLIQVGGRYRRYGQYMRYKGGVHAYVRGGQAGHVRARAGVCVCVCVCLCVCVCVTGQGRWHGAQWGTWWRQHGAAAGRLRARAARLGDGTRPVSPWARAAAGPTGPASAAAPAFNPPRLPPACAPPVGAPIAL